MKAIIGIGIAIFVLSISGAAIVLDHSQATAPDGHDRSHADQHDHGQTRPHGGHPAHGHGPHTTPPVDYLRERLDLTDEQVAEVKAVLDLLHEEMEELAKDFHDKLETLRSQAWTDIRAMLGEEQRSEFDKLIKGHPGHGTSRDREGAVWPGIDVRVPLPDGRGSLTGQGQKKLSVGEEVKDFTLTDSTGKDFRLGALRATDESKGKITVLTFWCTVCHSCRAIDKDLDRKARDYKDDGVQFLAVASNHTERPEDVSGFLKRSRLSFPVLMDSESQIARYFGASATTTTAVIDAEGRLRYYGRFWEAEDAVRNLMAGEAVANPETRPMGCAIMLKPQPREVTDDEGRGHDNGTHGARGHD